MSRRSRTAAILLTLAAAGCVASQPSPMAGDDDGEPTRAADAPPPSGPGPLPDPDDGTATTSKVPVGNESGRPTPAGQNRHASATTTEGLAVTAADTTGDALGIARFSLTLPVGALDGGQPGLPEWSARATMAVPPGGQQVPAVLETLERLGGGGSAIVGAATTQFSIWVPADAWEEALQALVTSVRFPGASRAWMQRTRADMVEASATRLSADPMGSVLDRLLVGDTGGPRSFLEGLQDATPAESLLFRQNYYQPGGAVLGLWVPDAPPQDVADRASEICASWAPSSLATPVRQTPLPPPELGGSVLWVRGADQPRAAIAIGLADARDPQGAELRCMHEALTMGGIGGRLERRLFDEEWFASDRARGLRFGSRWLSVDNRRFLMLETSGSAVSVQKQIEVLIDARRSLAGSLPSPSEADLSCRRARLLLLEERDGPSAWVQHAAWDQWLGGTGLDLAAQVARLDAPETLVFREAAGRFTSLPFVVVVIGGEPPENAGIPTRIVDLLPSAATQDVARSGLDAQLRAADAVLDAVVLGMGGEHQLRRSTAYDYQVVHRGNAIPEVTERVSVRGAKVQRTREILDTTIETSIDSERAVESAGASAVELTPSEVHALRLELERHPLQLLRSWVRGTLQFRLVGERTRETSRIAILECTTPRFARMRIEVDLDSNLIREIEWWRGNTIEGTTHIRERWSDYRILGGLRLPMHRSTELNDGAAIIESDWSAFSVEG